MKVLGTFIFGASGGGQVGLDILKRTRRKVRLLGFIDNDKLKQGKTFLGKNVYGPDRLKRRDWDKVYICSFYWYEIKTQLEELGYREGEDFEIITLAHTGKEIINPLPMPVSFILVFVLFALSIIWPEKLKI